MQSFLLSYFKFVTDNFVKRTMQQVISIQYKGAEYTFRLRINEQKTLRNWLTIKMTPAGEKFRQSFELIDNDHATIVWNQFANHFYSSNNALMLNDELMEILQEKIRAELIPSSK